MPELTVPVSEDTEARLTQLAQRTGRSIPELVRAAVEAYEARLFFNEMDETYAVLEADFREWGAYMADLTAWIDAGAVRPPEEGGEPDESPETLSDADVTQTSRD